MPYETYAFDLELAHSILAFACHALPAAGRRPVAQRTVLRRDHVRIWTFVRAIDRTRTLNHSVAAANDELENR